MTTRSDLQPLRRLVAPLAIEFGRRLLGHTIAGEPVAFRHFRAVAQELIAENVGAAADYLACLVAFDITADNTPPPAPPAPGRN